MKNSKGNIPPIYKGGLSSPTDIEKLIILEWNIIDKLWELAEKAQFDKHRAVYYQNLASHAKTLAMLLKLTGASTQQTEDLAKLLEQIAKKTKKFVKDLYGRSAAKA